MRRTDYRPLFWKNLRNLFYIMKYKFNWKRFLLYFIVIAGIYYIATFVVPEHPFLMTLGVILLLFVADYFLKEYDDKKRKED